MKYTSHRMIRWIKKDSPGLLTEFKVNKGDRDHQIWKREPLGVELFTPEVFSQKLDYIHNNPVRAGRVIMLKNIIIHQRNFIMMELIILKC